MTARIAHHGDQSTVNGIAIQAIWERAQPSRVQGFLNEDEWHRPAYLVRLPAAVLDKPYLLANASAVTWLPGGAKPWVGTVRDIERHTASDVVYAVTALVILDALD